MAPRSWARWREPMLGLLRIWCLIVGVLACRHAVVATHAACLVSGRRGGELASSVDVVLALLLGTGMAGLVLWAQCLRLRLLPHCAVHAVCTALDLAAMPQLCGCGVMEQAAPRAVVHGAYASASALAFPLASGGLALPPTPASECRTVLALLVAFGGFVVPNATLAARDCSEFWWHRQRYSGIHQGDWGAALYKRFAAVGDAGASAGSQWLGRLRLDSALYLAFTVLWGVLVLAPPVPWMMRLPALL